MLGRRGCPVEVALARGDSTVREVEMGVLEARQERAAVERDHVGRGPDQLPDLTVGADGHDSAVGHGEGLGARPGRVDGYDASSEKCELWCGHGHQSVCQRGAPGQPPIDGHGLADFRCCE